MQQPFNSQLELLNRNFNHFEMRQKENHDLAKKLLEINQLLCIGKSN